MTTTNDPATAMTCREHVGQGHGDVPVVIFDPSETDCRECNPPSRPAPINTGQYLGYEL